MHKNDPDYMFSSHTQINFLEEDRLKPPFSNINRDIKKHVVSVDNYSADWKSIKLV